MERPPRAYASRGDGVQFTGFKRRSLVPELLEPPCRLAEFVSCPASPSVTRDAGPMLMSPARAFKSLTGKLVLLPDQNVGLHAIHFVRRPIVDNHFLIRPRIERAGVNGHA
jgi:hypothetical protein